MPSVAHRENIQTEKRETTYLFRERKEDYTTRRRYYTATRMQLRKQPRPSVRQDYFRNRPHADLTTPSIGRMTNDYYNIAVSCRPSVIVIDRGLGDFNCAQHIVALL